MVVKFECIVCGKKFPQGQGVIISIGTRNYYFHSKRCALKFIRRALEEFDKDQLIQVFEKITKEFREERKSREELRKKVI